MELLLFTIQFSELYSYTLELICGVFKSKHVNAGVPVIG
jgi:hypothetical protein